MNKFDVNGVMKNPDNITLIKEGTFNADQCH